MPMTIVVVFLTVVGVTASMGNHDRSPLLIVGAIGMGAVMIAAMIVPGFPTLVGAAVTVILALLILAGVVGGRVSGRRPLDLWRKTAVAVMVVDLVFMSVAILLMPEHGALQRAVSTIPVGVGDAGTHAAMAGGLMVWLTLAAWAASAAVLVMPTLRQRSLAGVLHVVCSGSMIAAMVAMTM